MAYENYGQGRGREQYDVANRFDSREQYQSGDRYQQRDYYDRGQSYERYGYERNYYGHRQPYYNGYYDDRWYLRPPEEPKLDEFGSDKVADYLRNALRTSDTDGNGYLSRSEFDESQKNAQTPLDKQTAEFVSRHFGALSILSTDGYFSEGGISKEDVANLEEGNPMRDARNSYTQIYEDIGGKLGGMVGATAGMFAQAADFIFLGGTLTGVSVFGHIGAAAYVEVTEGSGPAGAMLPAAALAGGMMWGPMYGGFGGYFGGKYAGEQLSSGYFERKHEPQIQAMINDLNPPQT